ncbi:unnamed protein product [Amoebophrya sp. A25]|nr:unnamed protein product [Amoebophrya sp. A25]|eukprot:GSA25T00012596001.1
MIRKQPLVFLLCCAGFAIRLFLIASCASVALPLFITGRAAQVGERIGGPERIDENGALVGPLVVLAQDDHKEGHQGQQGHRREEEIRTAIAQLEGKRRLSPKTGVERGPHSDKNQPSAFMRRLPGTKSSGSGSGGGSSGGGSGSNDNNDENKKSSAVGRASGPIVIPLALSLGMSLLTHMR